MESNLEFGRFQNSEGCDG